MPFPFTFDFGVPGILNPFASPSKDPLAPPANSKLVKEGSRPYQTPADSQYHSQGVSGTAPGLISFPTYPTRFPSTYPIPNNQPAVVGTRRISRADLPKINRRRPSPSLSPSPAPLSRKRGWEPDPSPNWSTTSLTLASTSGYLDTPAKYQAMAPAAAEQNNDTNGNGYDPDYDEEMPPLKKRRGIAGSIVSTAVSAALIGTAVGLTVYRLWRDRGKEAQIEAAPPEADPTTQPPPPPYEENDWKPLPQPAALQAPPTPATPRTAARKRRHAPIVAKKPIVYHSARRSRPIPVASPAPTQPEFDFGRQEYEEETGHGVVEDKMDWIGDKLSMLIEQGKRALNAEVVVSSDAKEDEVDDGSGVWEEDDEDQYQQGRSGSRPSSRAGSIHSGTIKRSKKPRNIFPPPSAGTGLGLYGVNASSSTTLSYPSWQSRGLSSYSPPQSSTSTTYATAAASFAPSSVPQSMMYGSPRRGHVRGLSYESAAVSGSPSSFVEDSSSWDSPEMKESMERARARLLARRSGV